MEVRGAPCEQDGVTDGPHFLSEQPHLAGQPPHETPLRQSPASYCTSPSTMTPTVLCAKEGASDLRASAVGDVREVVVLTGDCWGPSCLQSGRIPPPARPVPRAALSPKGSARPPGQHTPRADRARTQHVPRAARSRRPC